MATTHKDQREIDGALENIRSQLNKLRSEIKAAPALESLKENQVTFHFYDLQLLNNESKIFQELEFAVLEEQLKMKAALIDRYKAQNFDNIHALSKEMSIQRNCHCSNVPHYFLMNFDFILSDMKLSYLAAAVNAAFTPVNGNQG